MRNASKPTRRRRADDNRALLSRRTVLKASAAAGAGAALGMAKVPAASSARRGAPTEEKRRTFHVGQFLLWLNDDAPVPQLAIAHVSEPQRMLWQSVPSSSFLIGGRAETVVEEN